MGYALLRRLSRLLLSLFYRRWSVANPGAVPAAGPIVVCANHHGSLVDPMLLFAGLERRLRPLAKAPLFGMPLVRTCLRAAGALPVYRPQDRHLVQGSNRDLLRACREALEGGAALLVFPEGISKPDPTLSALRPGAARMALEAEAAAGFGLGVRLVPVGIHLDEASRFRRGKLVALVGEPIDAGAFQAAWEREPEDAVQALTARLEERLRTLLAEVGSADELRLLRASVRAWARERGERLDDAAEAVVARDFARAWRLALEREPDAARRLRAGVEAYTRTLEHFRLTGGELDARYTAASIAGFLVGQVGRLALGAPLGLAGAAVNWPPFRATGLAAGRFADSEDSWASAKLAVALVAFPAWWVALGIGAALLAGPAWGAAALVAAPLLGLWAVRFRDRQAFVSRQVRAFLLLAGGGGLRRWLEATRRGIHDDVEALRQRLAAAGEPPGAAAPGA